MTTPDPLAAEGLDASILGAADRLREAFDRGETRPLEWRRNQLQQLKTMMSEQGDELVRALQADFGKPELEAWTSDIAIVSQECDHALKHLARWTRPEKVRTPLQQSPGRSRIVRDPLGVVLIISPWNYPVQLLLSPLVGAIAAGNCAVLKPSELTPHTSAVLAHWLPRTLDPRCFQTVEGGVAETTALLEQRFDHIFYTGNGNVGRVVMEAAAKHLTPVTLELGGKSPCIVDRSANLDVAARRIAWGKFLNAGQTCVAPDYILVHPDREEELIEKIGAAVNDFYGDDPKQSADYARIVNSRHHRRLAGLLKESGDIVFGGELDEETCYLAPTLVRNVQADSPLMGEEIFGPILPVLTSPSIEDSIAFVSQRAKPLALYVFTENADVEAKVIAETTSGGVCVNAILWHITSPNLPFGGVGPSGTGAYHGRASFETFSHRKSVMTKPTRFDLKLLYPPYSRLKTKLVRRML